MAEIYPTLASENLTKLHDESWQGEALSLGNEIDKTSAKKYYIETYGCAMNFNDSEIVASILNDAGFANTTDYNIADLVLINTCSIRENAEQRVRTRLGDFNELKKQRPDMLIGVLGCMAERLKTKFLEEEKLVDIVVGPDAYRDITKLIVNAEDGNRSVNVLLSRDETYADINPVRLNSNGVTAFISITRGCDNMCSFCVVPFTRGRERSRPVESILNEAKDLLSRGYKEVTLLGQNVDSYKYIDETTGEKTNFAQLLAKTAELNPALRVRFSTSHPKDMTDEVLYTITKHPNICRYVHLPMQSGSSRILKLMNRTYDRAWYRNRINAVKTIIPGCGISTDIIAGFCTETEDDHKETLSMMDEVVYDYSYTFSYSQRPGTLAERQYADDVDEKTKSHRLAEIVSKQREHSLQGNKLDIGKTFEVLVEGESKKSGDFMCGRNTQNKMIVFPKHNLKKGDYVNITVTSCTSATLLGDVAIEMKA
jgi:tRNA-2-methylthio-N6-dimethylallyladenosine synthase